MAIKLPPFTLFVWISFLSIAITWPLMTWSSKDTNTFFPCFSQILAKSREWVFLPILYSFFCVCVPLINKFAIILAFPPRGLVPRYQYHFIHFIFSTIGDCLLLHYIIQYFPENCKYNRKIGLMHAPPTIHY